MTNFSWQDDPLKGFRKHIDSMEENIPKIIVKHSNGYHGSDKDTCDYCREMYQSEHCECKKGTEKGKERCAEAVKELRNVLGILEQLKPKEQKALFKYLRFD